MGACTNKDLTRMDLMHMPDAFRLLGQVLCTYQLSSVVTCNELVYLKVSYVSPMSLTLRLL